MSDTPITLLARREIAQNTVYRVCFDHIRSSNGEEVGSFLAVVPKALGADQLGGVCVLPLAAGKVGLLKVWRHPLGRSGYEIPRGFIDQGESALAAAQRELVKETGIVIDAAHLEPLGYFTPEAALLQARVALFVAHLPGAFGAAGPEMGHTRFDWLPEAEIQAMLARGDIEDPATNIACLRYSLKKGGQHG